MKYRKKPVAVEAFQMTEARLDDWSEWPSWLLEAQLKGRAEEGSFYILKDRELYHPVVALIHTLESKGHDVTINDWIIRGVKGELYACKPDIFAMTYEEASNDTP